MGIVSSTFASLAIRFAWNCQRLLDPRYRSIEVSTASKPAAVVRAVTTVTATAAAAAVATESEVVLALRSAKATDHRLASGICLPAESNASSLHQKNRHRRAAQRRYRKRPSSFDASLILQEKNKYGTESGAATASGLVTNSMPNTLKRQPAPSWDSACSSSSSSRSSSDSSDGDSETEFMFASRSAVGPSEEEKKPDEKWTGDRADRTEMKDTTEEGAGENARMELAMSAAEEAAFRMTIGRGHFSRSKKDRFLNNLRLEKRLNGLSTEFFVSAYRAHKRSLRRRHSGDLRRIV